MLTYRDRVSLFGSWGLFGWKITKLASRFKKRDNYIFFFQQESINILGFYRKCFDNVQQTDTERENVFNLC